ncbi:MAG: hypothetical protein XE03_1964 [candidate division TA06 bacterium 34_109]|uniref:Uncharacterized protein n=1 Tax=candidate division TA06 bacterium 34_109 TaxID=1635277 RepID=A0A117M5K8_UNCT6|nr:MAG: hypothetical protein XE03_1964 [candidate division TA06 bacterium 34_109]
MKLLDNFIIQGESFPLRTPESKTNILFLIEEMILILSCSIEIIEIPILQDIQGESFPLRTPELHSR